MESTRRTTLVAAALAALPAKSATIYTGRPDVVAEAQFWSLSMLTTWKISLFADLSARRDVKHERASTNSMDSMDSMFHFHENEVAESHEREAFAKLPNYMGPPRPDVHPIDYEIALLISESQGLHRVKVRVARNMPATPELRLFFSIWHNIWRGIPQPPGAWFTK